MLKVFPVVTRADKARFCQFPIEHYAGDSNWIPMLRGFERELLGYTHHPFYDNAEIQTFLATNASRVVGRIAAIIDRSHNQAYAEQRGMFGFFESVDDRDVAGALFHSAFEWLRQRGMNCVRGPNSPSLNHQFAGCLVNAFDTPPTFMMPYNKPYYPDLIESQGFAKSQDLWAFRAEVEMLNHLDPKLKLAVDLATSRFPNMVVRQGNTKNLKADLESFIRLYNEGLRGIWGFVPLTDSEAAHIAKSLKLLIVPEMTTVIEIDGRAVAVAFGMLDYNPIIKKIRGRLFPFGALQIMWGRRKLKKVRLIGTYVAPEYQRWGLGVLLMSRMLPDILKWGIEEAEFSYVVESNKLSAGTLKRGGAILEKTYRLYDRAL